MSFWGIFLYSIRALAFAVPVGAVWAAVFFWRIKRRGEALHRTAFWSGLLLALYLAALLQITVIRDWGAFYAFMSQSHTMATVQPIPLKTTLEALEGGLWSLCYHVIGNMIWFVPFGLLGAAAYARLRRWRILLPEAAGLSLAIEAQQLAHRVQAGYPFVQVENILPALKRLRTLKAPCEIDAMRRAMTVTREGILRMMRASRPGMYEYEYKAEFDYALTQAGVLAPAFHSIISAGENNFCIHYDSYMGQAKDGDMILNDVGAQWDGECNDVSRGWPCNGKFSKEQRALYECALNTSNYMFSIIKPGMLMDDVDKTARRYCYEQLKKLGLLSSYDEIGKYMWHGGAHHVGYDVHDVVDALGKPIAPNMVFCVDIGIYVEDWGIGFRVEDNCLVTPSGCENLSASVPRTIEDIEAVMRK